MTIRGKAGDDNLSGTTGDDTFNLSLGGEDTVHGGGGNDTFWMGASLDAGDRIAGGTGTDTLDLNGDYSDGLVLAANMIVGIEEMFLKGGHSYDITMNDGNVAAGARFEVGAHGFGAGDTLTFDGSAEQDGYFAVYAGAGNDTLTGGAKGDQFHLESGGRDSVHGGAGDDIFYFGASLDANDVVDGGAGKRDTVVLDGDYSAGVDLTGVQGVEAFQLGAGHSYGASPWAAPTPRPARI